MRAGKLRHRVEIQTNTPTEDSYGEPIADWSTVLTVWAAIEPTSGAELLRGDEQIAEVTTIIRTRFNSNIVPGARFKEGSRIFEIQHVSNPANRDEMMESLCTETV